MSKPIAYMMLGLPGSGKTTYSKQLQEKLDIPYFSLDKEYFAVVGNEHQEQRDFKTEKKVGDQIKQKVIGELASGNSVVLDFCPWNSAERNQYKQFLEKHGAMCHIIYFDVPKEELLRRIDRRNKKADPGHQFVTPEMLNDFYERFDPPANEAVEVIKLEQAL